MLKAFRAGMNRITFAQNGHSAIDQSAMRAELSALSSLAASVRFAALLMPFAGTEDDKAAVLPDRKATVVSHLSRAELGKETHQFCAQLLSYLETHKNDLANGVTVFPFYLSFEALLRKCEHKERSCKDFGRGCEKWLEDSISMVEDEGNQVRLRAEWRKLLYGDDVSEGQA